MIHRKIGMAVLKDKHRQPSVKAVKTDFAQELISGTSHTYSVHKMTHFE